MMNRAYNKNIANGSHNFYSMCSTHTSEPAGEFLGYCNPLQDFREKKTMLNTLLNDSVNLQRPWISS